MPNKRSKPRIVVLDIETAPLQSYHWGLWKENIGLEQIGSEWSILSFCAKWLDGRDIEYHDTSGRGIKHVRNDAKLLTKLWRILDDADIVIAQNGKEFDIKKINTRFLLNKLPPPSPFRIVDTLQIAKQRFAFTSNRLAWMSKHITRIKKLPHKKFPGFELWAECLKDNPQAWKQMRLYNINDVLATEELYKLMLPWIENHPNINAFDDNNVIRCPKCGSIDVHKRGFAYTQSGQYHRYCCGACGGWSRSRYTLNSKSKRNSILAN